MADVPNVALRVSQLDAAELDGEIESMTKSQLAKLFKYHETNFLSSYEPEIDAGIKLLLWKACDSTFGQAMLNLQYRSDGRQVAGGGVPMMTGRAGGGVPMMTSRQKALYAWLHVGTPWFIQRAMDLLRLAGLQRWTGQAQVCIKWLETGYKLGTLVNFLVFLRRGTYLHILERLLGIRAVFPKQHGIRQVTFEFMTRELLWHGFAEFLFFVLPLINFQRVKNFLLKRLLPARKKQVPSQHVQRDITSCAVCRDWPIRPQEFGCPHVFCYFCLQSNLKADPGFQCPVCSHSVGDADNVNNLLVQSVRDEDNT